jgi:hypothetical protein
MKSLCENQEWQFNVSQSSAEKLNNFCIKEMVLALKGLTPDVWAMLDLLLMGDREAFETNSTADYDGDQVMLNSERSLLIYSKANIPQPWTLCGYVVYICKMPSIMEVYKKIRVVFFKINY